MISRIQWQEGVEDKGEAEEVSEQVGRGRKKGREGAKRTKTNDNDNNGTQKISKRKSTPKKRETNNVQECISWPIT